MVSGWWPPRCFSADMPKRLVANIPKCTSPISYHPPICSRHVPTCAHFCYKVVHCMCFFFWCNVEFLRRTYSYILLHGINATLSSCQHNESNRQGYISSLSTQIQHMGPTRLSSFVQFCRQLIMSNPRIPITQNSISFSIPTVSCGPFY